MIRTIREVLVIDDNQQSRNLLRNVVENAGFRVFEASTAEAGLEMAEKRVPHAVITDLLLPGESGFGYIEKHRSNGLLYDVPIIVVTGVRERDALVRALGAGANDYMLKPFEVRRLIQKLKEVLKNQKIMSHSLLPTDTSQVILKLTGQVVMASETRLVIEAPVQICEDTEVELTSPIVDDFACPSCVFRRSRVPVRLNRKCGFLNDIIMAGLTEAAVGRIKLVVGGWK